MTKTKHYGLVAAGAAARSLLADLPILRDGLGPVVSSSMKGAGRIVNVLKSGQAVRDASEMNECAVVLACAPDTGFDRVIAILNDDGLEWKGKILLFCDSGVSSVDYPQFKTRGALVGSLNTIDGIEKSFVVEGRRGRTSRGQAPGQKSRRKTRGSHIRRNRAFRCRAHLVQQPIYSVDR